MAEKKPKKREKPETDPDPDHDDLQTDEEWRAAIERDVQERYGEIMENAHWVDVGEPGW